MSKNSKAKKRRTRQRKRRSQKRGATTLVVETEGGILVREIPPTSALLCRETHGTAAEDSISGAADTWGLPDFVYGSEEVNKGDSRRELGDLFVIVENLAAVVQVKGRPEPTELPERECKWVSKQVKKAVSQASGTLRTLERTGATLRSRRGQQLAISKADYEWIKVVVIEHAAPPPEFSEIDFGLALDTVVLLRSDWDFLFNELRSTTGVLLYLQRAHGIRLGQHPTHYYHLAQKDEATPPEPPGFEPGVEGWRTEATPQMSLAPAGVDHGRRELLLRAIMEDAALAGLDADVMEEERLTTLSSLDRFPLVHRPALCEWIPAKMGFVLEASASKPSNVHVVSRNFVTEDPSIPNFAVVVCAAKVDEWLMTKFNERVVARHIIYKKMLDADPAGLRTVGLMITPAVNPSRLWDTTTLVAQGDVELSPAEEAALLEAYPMQPHDFET